MKLLCNFTNTPYPSSGLIFIFFARFGLIRWQNFPGIRFTGLRAFFPLAVALRQAAAARAVTGGNGCVFIGKKYPDFRLVGGQAAVRKTACRQAAVQQTVSF